jgi:hypothetical protein
MYYYRGFVQSCHGVIRRPDELGVDTILNFIGSESGKTSYECSGLQQGANSSM